MYLYETEDLGECAGKWTAVGPGTSPIGAQTEVCPMLRDMHGRYLDWSNYVQRTANPKDPLSGYKRFLNADCYGDYVALCRRLQEEERKRQEEMLRAIREKIRECPLWPWSSCVKPQTPKVPTPLKMRGA
jgi:hypothetical protein